MTLWRRWHVGAGALAVALWAAPVGSQPLQTPAVTDLADTLGPATQQQLARARQAESQGDWRQAETAFELVTLRAPGFAPALLGLGRARAAQGDAAGAQEAWRRLPADPDAVSLLAALIEPEDPAGAAALYLRLTRLRPGETQAWLDLARARGAAGELDQALAALQHWHGLVDGPPDGAVTLALGRALQEVGREEDAIALLEGYLARGAQGDAAEQARHRLDRMAVERAARGLAVGAGQPLGADARRRLDAARKRAVAGDPAGARVALRELVRKHPRSATARAALGDIYAQLDQLAEAEQAYSWAAALEPDEPDWHVRLGLLLADAYGGRRHAEARDELSRARALRPDSPELLFHLGRIQQETGQWEPARALLEDCVVRAPRGPYADEARSRLADLTRAPPTLAPPPELSSAPHPVPVAAVTGYRVARIYLDRGEPTRAQAELLPVLKLAPDWPAAINLQAAIAARAGDMAAAAVAWQRSLDADPAQPRVRLSLGEAAAREGRDDVAQAYFQQAAAGGVPEAWFRLAARSYDRHQLLDARDQLDAFFASSTGGLDQEPARQLQRVVLARLRLLQVGGGGLVFGGLTLLVGGVVRRRSGRSVEDLVARSPEAAHDAARTLSALRHEVIKHNTTLLDEVARALEDGDHHAVAFAATRLFGDDGDGGVVGRFERDLASLERLGRRHGVRLDLRRRDPVLAPMRAAMTRLRGLEPDLRRPWRASRRVPDLLRALSQALNRDGYAALGALLRRLGATDMDADCVERAWARVTAEPALVGRALADLELFAPDHPLPTRVLPGDLDDILANLLRNALVAVADSPPPRRLRVALEEEEDPITGLESVALRVLDSAPGELSTADIHGCELGRGLGLTADLVARHDGLISVERRADELALGFAKAVVVRLPRAETPESDALNLAPEPVDRDPPPELSV